MTVDKDKVIKARLYYETNLFVVFNLLQKDGDDEKIEWKS